MAEGRKVAPGVHALVVPGSKPVMEQAEAEGLDNVLLEAGFDWREPGCSMCLAMNSDRLEPGQRSLCPSPTHTYALICLEVSNRLVEALPLPLIQAVQSK